MTKETGMKTNNYSIFSTINEILGNQRGNVGFMGGGSDDGISSGDTSGDDSASSGDSNTSGDSGGIEYSYPEGFDEKLKGHASLAKFAGEDGKFNHAAIMKSYVHAQGMMGKDKFSVPDDTWTDDQYKELYNTLGRPEDLKDYGVKNNLAKGVGENKDFFDTFQETAYNMGLSTKQAQGMSDFLNKFTGDSISNSNEINEAAYKKDEDSLRSEWGDKYEHKVNRAFNALKDFASDAEIAEMSERGLMENTLIVKLFDKIANGMAEDSLNVKGGNTFGKTAEEAIQEIESYYKKGHPFSTKGHPEQRHYQEKMRRLQEIKLSSRRR